MKKILLMVFVSAFIASNAFAVEFVDWKSRQGFFIAGLGTAGYETYQTKKFEGGGGFRAGYGITEDIIIFGDATFSYMLQNTQQNNIVFDGLVKAQYYPWTNMYFNVGVGVSSGKFQTATMSSRQSRSGFATGAGAGYEFRFYKNFFVAPEAAIIYRRVAGTNYLTPYLGVLLGLHL